MENEFTQKETENGITYEVKFKFEKGVKKIIDKQVVEIHNKQVKPAHTKQPKQSKFTGKSKKNNYTPSPRTTSNNSKRGVYKNISTQPKNDKEAFNTLYTYTADLHDTKNENKEIVETIYNNRETIETATTEEEKIELREKIYNDFSADTTAKKNYRTLSKHSMFSLPPNLDLNKSIQADILKQTIIKTIDEMEEFKDHKYYINIHEDQINSNGGVHCHIVMAFHNKDGHSLHTKTRAELQQRDMKFKQKMTYNLYQQGITLDSPEKPPFKPDLHKELTFLEITKDNRVLVVDKIGEIRELRFKGCDEEVKKHNLQMGDKFDYVVEKTDEPKKDKDGNIIYINGKKQYEKERKFENIVTQEQLKEQVKQTQEQVIENRPESKLNEADKKDTAIDELLKSIEADKKEISGFKGIFKTKSQKAEIQEKINNKELAVKAIELKDAIKNITPTQLALTIYSNNPFISSDERNKIIKEATFIKDIDDFGRNYSKIAQYLPNEVKENIKEYIIDPYNQMKEQIYRNPYLREERISKSDKKKELQKRIIEFCPEMTKYNQELKQLQEKQARSYQDIQRQYQYNSTEQSKSISKSNEIPQNTPTRTPSQNKDKTKNKDKEKDIGW